MSIHKTLKYEKSEIPVDSHRCWVVIREITTSHCKETLTLGKICEWLRGPYKVTFAAYNNFNIELAEMEAIENKMKELALERFSELNCEKAEIIFTSQTMNFDTEFKQDISVEVQNAGI